MSVRNLATGFILIAVVAGLGFLSYQWVRKQDRQCDICGRVAESDHRAVANLKDGTEIHACCPRCLMHYRQHSPETVQRLSVMDFVSGAMIPAETAYYVEGSNEHSCRMPSETTPREWGVGYELMFDRCLPGLVSFQTLNAARDFAREHDGRILDFSQTLESVTRR